MINIKNKENYVLKYTARWPVPASLAYTSHTCVKVNSARQDTSRQGLGCLKNITEQNSDESGYLAITPFEKLIGDEQP